MPTGVMVSGIRKATLKKRRNGSGWTASMAEAKSQQELYPDADDTKEQGHDHGTWPAAVAHQCLAEVEQEEDQGRRANGSDDEECASDRVGSGTRGGGANPAKAAVPTTIAQPRGLGFLSRPRKWTRSVPKSSWFKLVSPDEVEVDRPRP